MTASNNPTSSGSSNCTADSAVALVHGPNPDLVVLAGIPSKLQRLAIRTQLSPPQHMSDSLQQLDSLLDLLLAGSTETHVLPKLRKVAPNQGSWLETASVMGAKPKTKRNTTHTDPYSGGQGSGKKAKKDARAPLAAKRARCVIFYISYRMH